MIRQAKKQDAKVCIDLLNLAMQDIAFTLSGVSEQGRSDEILRGFFELEICRLSYQNIYVFENNGEIIGAICGYFGGDLEILDAPICSHLQGLGVAKMPEIECEKDEFYIDSVAVSENFRNQGIARNLINFLCEKATLKYSKISLIVSDEKTAERAFYERLGFKFNKEKTINNHRYFHLIKELK